MSTRLYCTTVLVSTVVSLGVTTAALLEGTEVSTAVILGGSTVLLQGTAATLQKVLRYYYRQYCSTSQ